MGIDVAARFHDIRLIVLKHCKRAGVDSDDLVQETVMAIARKNLSEASRFDPARAAFSHYVVMVGNGKASHLAEKNARHARATSADLDEAAEVAEHRDPLAALDVVEAASDEGVDIVRSREAGELVRRPRAPLELAIDQRAKSRLRSAAERGSRSARPFLAAPAVLSVDLADAAEPDAAPRTLKNEGQRLLRIADRLDGRAALALAAGVAPARVRAYLTGYYLPGPETRARLLAELGIAVEAWELDAITDDDGAEVPRALPHEELLAQLRASLVAAGYSDTAPRCPDMLAPDLAPTFTAAVDNDAATAPPVSCSRPIAPPFARRRLRGAASFYFDDLAAAAPGPLAGYDPFAARAAECG